MVGLWLPVELEMLGVGVVMIEVAGDSFALVARADCGSSKVIRSAGRKLAVVVVGRKKESSEAKVNS